MPETVVRKCGGCTLCCKLIAVAELQKDAGVSCQFCHAGEKCSIYNVRPDGCKSFECLWLMFSKMPEDFRPDRVHCVLQFDEVANFLNVHMDEHISEVPQRLNDWLKIFVSVCNSKVNLIRAGKVEQYDPTKNERVQINEKSDGILIAGN